MEKLPKFGRKLVGKDYIFRPSAYALIRGADGTVAVVRTARGFFLLGGGQEGLETPEDALMREAREECGCELHVGKRVAVADEFLFTEKDHAYFRIRCTFFLAEISAHDPASATETDHVLHWTSVEEAVDGLVRESHRWAVRQAFAETKLNQSSGPTSTAVTTPAAREIVPAAAAHL